jgi:Leucine-rich repeat (LRR) protein
LKKNNTLSTYMPFPQYESLYIKTTQGTRVIKRAPTLEETRNNSSKLVLIPIRQLLNLPNLRALRLSGLGLFELPREIGTLTNLLELDVSINKLSKLPDELIQLTDLIVLNVSLNRIKIIPDLHILPNLNKYVTYGQERIVS